MNCSRRIPLLFRPITINDLSLYKKHVHHEIEVSDLSFVSLYIWKDSYQVKLAEFKDALLFLCVYREETYLLPPLGTTEAILPLLKEAVSYFHRQEMPFKMKAVPPGTAEFILANLPGRYSLAPDRKNWDYIYLTKDLIELKGRKYQQKRNHLNKFKQTYDYSYEPLTRKYIDDCFRMFEEWAEDKGDSPTIQEERLALTKALQNMDALQLKGGVLRVNGRVEAFSLGSLLNRETALIHFEKANHKLSGIYSVINQHFVEKAWFMTKYINREDDMGVPGLREAKKRYHPARMIEKYVITEER